MMPYHLYARRAAGLPCAIVCVALAAARAPAASTPGHDLPEANPVSIPMRDGKGLAADVYVPTTGGRVPTILIMTPYSRVHFRGSRDSVHSTIFDHDHYAYVTVDWRGFYGSKSARTRSGRRASTSL